jgi:hypothetical protein
MFSYSSGSGRSRLYEIFSDWGLPLQLEGEYHHLFDLLDRVFTLCSTEAPNLRNCLDWTDLSLKLVVSPNDANV